MPWLKRVGLMEVSRQGHEVRRWASRLITLLGLLAATAGVHAGPAPCESLSYEANDYTVCIVDLQREAVRLFWKAPDGTPYGYLHALSHIPEAPRLVFATNAGMFDADSRPVGLYIENGRELVHANTRTGYGNFHMRPNGVFYVADRTAGVLETTAFLRQRPRADFATQSGPMLVINGRLHPRFALQGGSHKLRDGIGIVGPSTLAVAISDGEVSFAEFGRLFAERLKCANALFLDGGSVPSLYIPGSGRAGNLLPIGPMIGVFEESP